MAVISVLDQHILVDQAIQRFSAFAYRDVDSQEIDIQLNRAMYRVIDDILDPSPQDKEIEGFERNTQMLDMLRPLLERTTEVAYTSDGFTLPDDYYHLVKVRCEVGKTCEGETTYKYEKVRIGETEDEDELIDHPFARSDYKSLLGFIRGNKIYIYAPDGYTLQNIQIDYIRKPQQIKFATDTNGNFSPNDSTDCELEGNGAYKVTDYAIAYIQKAIDANPNKVNVFDNEKIN